MADPEEQLPKTDEAPEEKPDTTEQKLTEKDEEKQEDLSQDATQSKGEEIAQTDSPPATSPEKELAEQGAEEPPATAAQEANAAVESNVNATDEAITIADGAELVTDGAAETTEVKTEVVDKEESPVVDAQTTAIEPSSEQVELSKEEKPEHQDQSKMGETVQTVNNEAPVIDGQDSERPPAVRPPTTPAGDSLADATVDAATEKSPDGETTERDESLVPQEIPSATVKFVLLPTAQVATMKCALNQTLKELKEHFALELKIPAGVILLLHEGSNIENEKTLADLGVGPNGTVQLEMQSADPVNTPIKAFRPRQEYVMPDVITVRVETEPTRYKDVVVEVERFTRKKPYLGGYRHKQTGAEFHHASAQTGPKMRGVSNIERYCRDTQTYEMKHIRQQTSEDTYTQMTKIGVYVSNMEDKLLIPGKYTTAEQHHKIILKKVIILQKYWRRWLASRYVTKLKVDRQKRLDWEKQEEIKKREEKELRIKREFERRMNPKSKEDFDLLYSALEKWRLEEMDKIDQSLSGAERKAALCQLLDQETQLIGSIGRHKQDADSDNREKIVQSFLNKAAAPKKWRGPDGGFTEMDTPYTIRAQELRDIYNSICMKYLTQDERLDVLLTLKHTVKEHDCKLTQEIIELIDREADLLMRGVRDANLEGLRKRISTLFLQYIKTPTFNPEAARLLKVPQDPSTLRQNIYYCASCNRYLQSVEFQLSTNSRTVGRCRKCRHLDNDARTRQDYSHYRLMLRDLRRLEESYGDDSKVAFLLQENDLRYLVEKIWNSQSIVSAWDDLYDLILVRWDKHREWSPWNCVLITKEESSAHERLETLSEGYGKELIHKVHRKHALARNYFSRLPGMSEHMRKRVTEPHDGPAVEGISVN